MTSLATIQIRTLPQSIEEFRTLRDQIAKTPQGGAAIMVLALYLYTQDKTLGQQCLTVAIDSKNLEEGPHGYHGWQLHRNDSERIRRQLAAQPYLPLSYLKGATPENNYNLPPLPYTLEFSSNPYSGDETSGPYKVFTACSGAPSPRPITLRKNNREIWKAYEWSSLVVGIRKPKSENDDTL